MRYFYHLLLSISILPLIFNNQSLEAKNDAPLDTFKQGSKLILLSIGTSTSFSPYQIKDAQDFAAHFKQQGNSVFNEIIIKEYAQPNQTTFLEIKKAFLDLKVKYKLGQVTSKDVVLVFISSNGIVGSEGNLKIIPTGYDPKYGDELAVDYKRDILDQLLTMDCIKLVVIDAAPYRFPSPRYSDHPTQREPISAFTTLYPNLATLVSHQTNESSYADKQWQNGTFTRAVLLGLKNSKVTSLSGEVYRASSNDDIVTLGELFSFIKKWVPEMVKQTRPEGYPSQNPELYSKDQLFELPLSKADQ